jgi:hypothetical protein
MVKRQAKKIIKKNQFKYKTEKEVKEILGLKYRNII